MASDRGQVTLLLDAATGGNVDALNKLMPLVYEELRALAKSRMRREKSHHTLQTTALIHEAYVRLVDQKRVQWKNRQHFFAIAAQMMRRVLVNHARDRRAEKRGGGRQKVPLDERIGVADEATKVDLLALDDALNDLAASDERLSRVVEMRYFGGMSIDEIGGVLGVAPRTVKRYWKAAKLLLYEKLGAEE